MAGEGAPNRSAAGQVPHSQSLVSAGDDYWAAIEFGHRYRPHPPGVAGKWVTGSVAAGQITYPHRPVTAAGDDHGAAVQLGQCHSIHQVTMVSKGFTGSVFGGQVP